MLMNIEYPEVVTNIKDVRLAIEAGDKAGARLERAMDELDNDIDISSSEESGIARREAILGIKPLGTATLESRKVEVLLRWFDSPIYTETTLRQKLDGAIGVGQYVLDVNLEEKLISCKITVMSKPILRVVREMFEKMIPLDYAVSALIWIVHDILALVKTTYQAGIVFTVPVIVRGKPRTLDGSWPLDGSCLLDATWRLGVYGARHDCHVGVRQEAAYGAMIEARKDLWRLDGTVKLDGSRRLDAEIHGLQL